MSSERHVEVLHEIAHTRREVDRLKLGVMVGALGHEVVVPTRRGLYGTQEVNADKLKPLRDIGLAQLGANGRAVKFTLVSAMFRVAS